MHIHHASSLLSDLNQCQYGIGTEYKPTFLIIQPCNIVIKKVYPNIHRNWSHTSYVNSASLSIIMWDRFRENGMISNILEV